tara:strand:- start:3331 stop:3981 length:651 start_codon:yes stop_codon:yes gene_type:complete
MIMATYNIVKEQDIVWIQAGRKHLLSDVKKNKDYYWSAGVSDEDNYGCGFIGGETARGWFRVPAKVWKTKKTPISYNNSTKVIKFMGFNGKYYSFKLKPAAFTKAKKIIDSYNKKWDVKELAKKKTPAKKPATRKRKTPAKKPATRKRKTPAKKPATRKRKTPAKKAPVYKGKRPSPSISATAVKAGTKRRGGSGKMYVAKSYKINGKKVQRWVQA